MHAHSVADDVKLYFFGAPLIERSGSSVPVDRQKAIALLAYLVLTGRRHHRDVLAALLWPELDQTRARAGLRRVLDTLRGAIGGDRVLADRESVGLRWPDSLWADVAAFQQRLADSRLHGAQRGIDPTGQLLLEEAVALYRADLLAGFNLRDAPEFENWLCLERETLRRAVTSALELLVQLHAAHGSYGPALDFAQRWLALEPEEERAHQALDRALPAQQRSGWRRAGSTSSCKRVLAEELGVPPSAETRQLDRRQPASVAPSAAPVAAQVAPLDAGLPVATTRLATVLVTGLEPLADVDDTFGAASEPAIQRQDRFVQAAQEILPALWRLCRPESGRQDPGRLRHPGQP